MELFTPELGLVFWMFVVFAILFAILAKIAWPFIIRSIDERAPLLTGESNVPKKLKIVSIKPKKKPMPFWSKLQKQQLDILREAAQLKSQIIEEARKAAGVEAKKVMDAAAVSIEQARKESELQFRTEVSTFALQIAEKMMRKELSSDKAQAEMIDKLLNDIENKN